MAAIIEGTPGQIEFALSDPDFPDIPARAYDRVVVAGMGGSALAVDVLMAAFGGRLRLPVDVCRHYEVPSDAGANTLAIASSFSGNTEETLEAAERLAAQGAEIVVLSAGGQLAERARAAGQPFVRIPREREPEGFQPRCAAGYGVAYLARILESAELVADATQELGDLPGFLRGLDVRSEAEEVARWLGDRIPILYADERHERSIARIAKIKFNENAKRPAFYNCLPEANHNEMIGFRVPLGSFALLYLRDADSHPAVERRFDVMRDVFAQSHFDHVDFRAWSIPGSSALEKSFASMAFCDWCTRARALLDGFDPTPVDLVESFKKELGRRSG